MHTASMPSRSSPSAFEFGNCNRRRLAERIALRVGYAARRRTRRQGPLDMDKSNKMLIDATHPEETRVVVLRNGRVEEFDYESANRKLLRGNIYLAKVTRVEPSLQAAFVDYGGNRHGFLAFSEIHPDYYRIPVGDRGAIDDESVGDEAEALEAAEDEAGVPLAVALPEAVTVAALPESGEDEAKETEPSAPNETGFDQAAPSSSSEA